MTDKVENHNENVQIPNNEEPNGEATCRISFDNNESRVYYTGQTVRGRINLAINETTIVRAIYANVVGRAFCMWSIRSGNSKHRTTVNNSKEEIYFNRKIYYLGDRSNSSDRTITVESGEYEYFFDCTIPDECHTSVEENNGSIRYSVTVVIEEDFDRKKEFVENFTVIKPLNLNDDVTHSYSLSDEAEFIFTKYCCCCCCFETDPVKFAVKIPKRGYAPGQRIEITINVNNKSDQSYEKFIGNIFKNVQFFANDKTSSSEEKLATFDCEGCPAGETLSRKLIVTVPPTPPTEKSNICTISYQLQVQAFGDCCRDDLKLEFPLTIGTHPIQSTTAQTGGIVVTQQPTKLNEDASTMQPLLNDISLSQRTTIEDGNRTVTVQPIFQKGESCRCDKDISFVPMYPMYTNSQYPLDFTIKVEAGEVKPIKM